ncbi:adenylate/guanylate cyclase domain-containing protein [Dongia deserti]|uniref:adenylate/guanylate cyclase domain-containing protein n=1 Tax=Dongia deserti TaxID=2268030 RepID=UPI000E64EA96|nr:adenylate/guanylate cyclase domain-containing protein [Dongia deserti]
MKTRVRFAAIVAILSFLIGAVTERLLTYGLSFDALLTLRHAIFGDRHLEETPHVVVVNIDEDTFKATAFKDIPSALWAPQFGTVLDALDAAGAKVIGVDIIFSTIAETVVRGHDRPLFASLHRLAAAERVVLAKTDAGGSRTFDQHRFIGSVVGFQKNIRSANVHIGLDGVVRYVPLWHGVGAERVPSFAPTIAQRAGFDIGQLPENLRHLAPNYGDVSVAPVYAMQDVHQCAVSGAMEPLANAFAGKIVLIGAEFDVEDRKSTPGRAFLESSNPKLLPCGTESKAERIGRRTIPGVFIHAQAVNDLMRGELARFWPGWAVLLACTVMATGGSVFSIFLRAQTASLLLAGTLLLWLAGTVASASVDWFAPLLGGVTAAVAAFLIGLGLRTFVIDRERRRMALALSRYLDVHLAQKLMESDQPPELGGEAREVTVWFSDIAGFSTLAEKMDAKELVTELNAHFAMIGQAIEAEGGIIDKYVGDAVVAIFGALVPLPNHAAAAMRAALKVQEKLRAEAGKAGAFRIRIGLNTGSCVVGNVGSINRINYTAIGDAVNVAARLEAANKELGTSILASESTVRAAGTGFVCRSLGAIHVRGRAEEVTVHEVLGPQSPQSAETVHSELPRLP